MVIKYWTAPVSPKGCGRFTPSSPPVRRANPAAPTDADREIERFLRDAEPPGMTIGSRRLR